MGIPAFCRYVFSVLKWSVSFYEEIQAEILSIFHGVGVCRLSLGRLFFRS